MNFIECTQHKTTIYDDEKILINLDNVISIVQLENGRCRIWFGETDKSFVFEDVKESLDQIKGLIREYSKKEPDNQQTGSGYIEGC